MSPRKSRRKQDNLSYGEFSRLIPQANPNPEQDSPGDSAEDKLTEILVGMDYGEESEEDLRDPAEDEEEEDPLHPEKIGESFENLEEDARVIASTPPDFPDELSRD